MESTTRDRRPTRDDAVTYSSSDLAFLREVCTEADSWDRAAVIEGECAHSGGMVCGCRRTEEVVTLGYRREAELVGGEL